MIPIDELEPVPGDDKSLAAMAADARAFLLAQSWCKSIRMGYLDLGWEGILGVFWFEIEPASDDVDRSVWVVVGDVPPAYICNDNPDGRSALEAYALEMQRWVDAVRAGEPLDNVIPVSAPPERESADLLDSRLRFIRERLLADSDQRDDEG